MIYLDYNASTPIEPQVQEFLSAAYAEIQINAGSITHALGRAAAAQLEEARAAVATTLSAEARDLVFCRSATEALNIVIRGAAEQYQDKGRHILCSAIEHAAVRNVLDHLQERGFEIEVLPVDEQGYLSLEAVQQRLRDDTILCICMHVNNEIGTIQDIRALSQLCYDRGVKTIVDAAQSWGKLPLNVQEVPVDALVMSAHKSYGPQGVAAMYARRKPARLRMRPQLFGGGQERGLSPGTVPVVLARAMAQTGIINQSRLAADQEHVDALRAHALQQLAQELPQAQINGDVSKGIAGTLSIQIPGIDAQQLLCSIDDVCLAMGSACTSSVPRPSHVLRAIGLNWQAAAASIRMSFGRFSTTDEITQAIRQIATAVSEMTPMTEAG